MRITYVLYGLLAALAVTAGPAMAQTQQEDESRYQSELRDHNFELMRLQGSHLIYEKCGERIGILQTSFYDSSLFLHNLECETDSNGNLQIQEPSM
jgi:hypothetical protein